MQEAALGGGVMAKRASILDQPATAIDMRPARLDRLLGDGQVDAALAFIREAFEAGEVDWIARKFAGVGAEDAARAVFAERAPTRPKKLTIAEVLGLVRRGCAGEGEAGEQPEGEADEVARLAAAAAAEQEPIYDPDEELAKAVEARDAALAAAARAPAEPKRATPIHQPRALGLPDGVVGEMANYVLRSAAYPVASIAYAVAIGVAGTLVGRRIAGPSHARGCGTHTYQAIVGPTGLGKEHADGTAKGLLTAAGASQLIGPGRFKSDAGIISHLIKRSPVSLCVMDELGSYFTKLANPRQFEAESIAIFRGLWGKNWTRYDSPAGADAVSQPIISPSLSLLGMSTIKEIGRACTGRDATNGFLNRWTIKVEHERSAYQRVGEKELVIPKPLRDALRKLYPSHQILDQVTDGVPQKRLAWAAGAEEFFEAMEAAVRAEKDPRRRDVFQRQPEKTVRIAACIAAGRFAESVSLADMEWAAAWVVDGHSSYSRDL
jgi:hypothetical protein